MTDIDMEAFNGFVRFLIVMIVLLCFVSCNYCCIKFCQKCKKKNEQDLHNAEIDKNLSKRENDWWVKSGGPPVNNGGEIIFDEQ